MKENYIRLVNQTDSVLAVLNEAVKHRADIWIDFESESAVISTHFVFGHIKYFAYGDLNA